MYKNKKGFTLIEILIAVGIISVLTGVLLSVLNVGGLRSKTRDGQRVSDLKKFQAALELYYADVRSYPVSNGWVDATSFFKSEEDNAVFVNGNYLQVIPKDPLYTGSVGGCCTAGAAYAYRSDGAHYIVSAQMEIQESVLPSKCSALNRASDFGCGNCTSPLDGPYCYGVASPF